MKDVRKLLSMFLSCWPQIKMPNKREKLSCPGIAELIYYYPLSANAKQTASCILKAYRTQCPVTFFNWLLVKATGKSNAMPNMTKKLHFGMTQKTRKDKQNIAMIKMLKNINNMILII